MQVTIREVARKANSNVGSVSRVLNNHARAQEIKQETRQRIIQATKELGYQRNELAATTRTGINRTVALIGDFDSPGPSSFINTVMSGILRAATENDYGVRIYSPDKLDACMDEIRSQRIKNVIVESINPECRKRMAEFCQANQLHLVYVFEQSDDELPVVATADREGMKNAVRRLVEHGHSQIALLCAEHNFHYMDERHQGYLEGMEETEICPNEHLIDCSLEIRDCRLAIETMLQLPEQQHPTAFVCIGDILALQAKEATLMRGLRVPEDISIIGFGDADICEGIKLTSVAQPFKKMGRTALEIALGKDCCAKPNEKNEYLLPTEFIERGSVGELRIKNL